MLNKYQRQDLIERKEKQQKEWWEGINKEFEERKRKELIEKFFRAFEEKEFEEAAQIAAIIFKKEEK